MSHKTPKQLTESLGKVLAFSFKRQEKNPKMKTTRKLFLNRPPTIIDGLPLDSLPFPLFSPFAKAFDHSADDAKIH